MRKSKIRPPKTVTHTRSERLAKRRHKRKLGPAALRRAERRQPLQTAYAQKKES